jgi:hypothetical protein
LHFRTYIAAGIHNRDGDLAGRFKYSDLEAVVDEEMGMSEFQTEPEEEGEFLEDLQRKGCVGDAGGKPLLPSSLLSEARG